VTLQSVYGEGVFDRYLVLGSGGKIQGVWGKDGKRLD